MTNFAKFNRRVAAAATVAVALGASTAMADGSTPAGATPAGTGTTSTSPWNPADIAPADGAVIKSGEPDFRWQLPAADAYSTSYILVTEKRNSRVTAAGKLIDTSRGGEGVGNTLGWPKHTYLWTKDDGGSPLLAGQYLWQIQANDANTGQEDDMPVRSFTVPGWIKLGHLKADVYANPATGNDVIQFVGHLLGNINNQDSMDAHPKDGWAQFVCAGTGTFKLGRRTVLVAHEKQDCSSAVAEWGQVVFAVPSTKIKAPAGAHLTAQLTVSGDGVTVKSNPMPFVQP